MRIERLALERYGIFSDRELAFAPDATLHVVFGANEAGKTSALSAIGDLLFGFPMRTDYDFRHDSKVLRIGGTFRHSNGKIITARRRKGNKNTLLDANDQPLPDDLLDLLFAGTSRETFSREFGMTAAALRAGGEELLSAGGRLAETLAASSAGMAGLSSVQENLQKSADELFTSTRRSSGKPFYSASDRRDRADKEFREATVTPDALKQIRAAEEEAVARLDELKVAHAASGGLVGRLQRTLRVRSQLARLDRIGDELGALQDLPDLAKQSVADWRATLNERAVLESEISGLDAAAQSEVIELEALAVDDALLSEATTVESLRERLGAVRKATEDLPRRKQARDSAEAVLNDAARKLGLTSHTELLQGLPTDFALADARALTNQIGQVSQKLIEVEARYARSEQELRTYEGEGAEGELVRDIEPLKQRFNALGDISALQSQLRRDQASLTIELRGISDGAMALDPSPGSADKLRSLQLPDLSAITEFVKAVEVLEAEVRRLRAAVVVHDKALADTGSEVVRLTSAGIVPTRTDLTDARIARDEQLERLQAEIDEDRSIRTERIEGVVRTSQKIDGITDGLLSDTQRATRLEDAQQRIAGLRKEREADSNQLVEFEAELARIGQEWRDAWLSSGLVPRLPAEMQHWRTRFDELVSRSDKCDARQADVDAIAAGLGAAKVAVITFLESTGRRSDPKLPADILYQEAKACGHGSNRAAWLRDIGARGGRSFCVELGRSAKSQPRTRGAQCRDD